METKIEKGEEIDKIRNEIKIKINENPSFKKYLKNIDSDNLGLLAWTNSKIDKLLKIKSFSLDTSIKEVIDIISTDQIAKNEIIFQLHTFEVKTIKDLINLSFDSWDDLLENTDQIYEYEAIAIELFPKFKFNMPLSKYLVFSVFSKQCDPNNNLLIKRKCQEIFEELTTNKSDKELIQVYNDIYHGVKAPEAPPPPFQLWFK